MLNPSIPLAEFSKGQGGGHHQTPVRTLTADGLRVVGFIKSLTDVRQQAAVTTAFTRMGLQVNDTMTNEAYNGVMAGNGPPRYDFHTGLYYGDLSAVEICPDESLHVAAGHHP